MSSSSSQSQTQTATHKAPTASEIHHALLRPAILQILRAQGYYSSTAGTVDALTELAGSYISAIAQQTAHRAALNNELSLSPTIVDVRMGLEDCGALCPQRDFSVQELRGEEDTRGVDEFIRWAKGRKNQRIRKVAGLHRPVVVGEEGEVEEERETDYLSGRLMSFRETENILRANRRFPHSSTEEEAQPVRPGLQVRRHHPRQGHRTRRGQCRGWRCG